MDMVRIGPEREALRLILKRPATLGEPESLAMAMRRLNAA
jgi:hypothetical protein